MTMQKMLQTTSVKVADDILAQSGLYTDFWRKIFLEASSKNASDIHFEPYSQSVIIRLRVRGDMIKYGEFEIDTNLKKQYMDLLKKLSRADVSTIVSAQDCSFSLSLTKSRYRVAITPTLYGEDAVLRIIPNDSLPCLDNLNYEEGLTAALRSSLKKRSGIILVTGPTGSGKSTLLDAALCELNNSKLKILSISDPIERVIPGVIHQEISSNYSWPEAIKFSMRKDPDVIVIGEIRDPESAKLAFDASQTGHLVISTLHTNNVATTISRLIRLGVDRQTIADNLTFVSNQRLVQVLCPHCKIEISPEVYEQNHHGCNQCLNTGIEKRLPLVEFCAEIDRKSILNFESEEIFSDFNCYQTIDQKIEQQRKSISCTYAH